MPRRRSRDDRVRRKGSCRWGFTLLETLVTLLLGLLLAVLAWRTLAGARRVSEALALRGEALDALRTARHVLAWEFRAGASLVLAGEPSADTVGVRALRGLALVCPGSAMGTGVVVVPDGVRAPDAGKDSAWILGSDGDRALLAITASDAGPPCAALGNKAALRWTLSGEVPREAALALYFERGSYHLSGGALRYRRGEGGRQPLTPERLRLPPSRFEGWGGGVAVRLAPTHPGALARGVLSFVVPAAGGGW